MGAEGVGNVRLKRGKNCLLSIKTVRGRGVKSRDVRQETGDRRHETRDRRRETRVRRHETGERRHKTRNVRHEM